MTDQVPSSSFALDAANPWPGLSSFTEDAREFFYGREKETDELARCVRRHTLTVLFGQSGLGKSSLIQAGLFPLLRDADFLPLYLRLDHSGELAIADGPLPIAGNSAAAPSIGDRLPSAQRDSPPSAVGNALADQVKAALTAAFAAAKADAPAFRADETLWEYFHRKDVDIWSAKNRLLTPVLAFDQFEEIFTLGRANEAARDRSRAFITELACLVENRAPPAVQAKLDRGELDPARFTFDKPSCQVILSLREDFLPDLEGLKQEMPALIHNRMRLKRLSGTQALEIVTKPGGHLVADGVAERIVEFVAGARGGSTERLAELDVEPPLLSVICRALNDKRRALGQEKITADLVSGNRREILTDFYERSVADLPADMRAFVEDHLLTKSGYRDNLALETALEFPGVTRPLIDTLVARRLLRIEDRLGVQRVELTHDVLAEVIRAARDARQQRLALEAAAAREREALADAARRARRQRFVIAGLAAAVVALLIGAFFGIRAQRRAERLARDQAAQSSRTDFILGSRLLEENKTPEGLAYLVRAAKSDRTNHSIGPRLLTALAYRSFGEPVGKPIVHENAITYLRLLNENRLLTAGAVFLTDGEHRRPLTLWNLETGEQVRSFDFGLLLGIGGVVLNRFSLDGRWFAEVLADESVTVREVDTGRRVAGPWQHSQRVLSLAFSPDQRWLLTSSADEMVRIWDVASGELKASVPYPTPGYGFIGVSRDSSRFVTTGAGLRIWRLPEATPLTDQLSQTGPGPGGHLAEFTRDGKYFLVVNGAAAVQVYDGISGAPVGARMTHGGQTLYARFSHDGTKLVSFSSDGAARLWEVPTGKLIVPPLQHGADVNDAQFTSDNAYLVTRSGDGLCRVWRVATGQLALESIKTGGSVNTHPTRPEIILVGVDGVVRRWQISPSAVSPMEIPADPHRLAIVRDAAGKPAAWSIYPTRMQKIDLLSGAALGSAIEFPTPLRGNVALSPNEKHLLAATEAGELELWQLDRTVVSRRVLGPGQNAGYVRFSPDSSFVARSGQGGLNLTVWDAKTGDVVIGPVADLGILRSRHLFPYSPSSRFLLAENATPNQNTVAVVDLARRQVGERIRNGGSVWGIALSPDERSLALGNSNGAVQLWDVATNQRAGAPFEPRRSIIRGTAFDRSGGRLLTWNRLEVYLWDVTTRKRLLPIMPAGTDVITAIFSPDESRIASFATTRGEIRIFETATGAMLGEPILGAHATNASPLTFTADGRFIIASTPPPPGAPSGPTSSTTGLVVWPVPPASSEQPLPDWLLEIATGVAGGELNRDGALQEHASGATKFEQARAEVAKLPADAPYAEWGRWILADRETRPIGPGLKITAAELRKQQDAVAPKATGN